MDSLAEVSEMELRSHISSTEHPKHAHTLLSSGIVVLCVLGLVSVVVGIVELAKGVQPVTLENLAGLTLLFLVMAPWSVKMPSGAAWRPAMAMATVSMFVLPLPLSPLVAVPGLVLVTAKGRPAAWRYLLTIGHVAAGLYAGTWVYQTFAPGVHIRLTSMLAPAVSALIVHLAINRLLSAVIVSHRQRLPLKVQAVKSLREVNWVHFEMYLMSIFVALLCNDEGPWILLLAGFLQFGLYQAISYYSRMQVWQNAAWTDGLTGIGNRAAWETFFARIKQQRTPGTLAVIDLDDFKQINDRSGHAVGDQILRDTADALRRHLQKSSHVFRYGGDEFVVFYSSTLGDSDQLRSDIEAAVSSIDDALSSQGMSVRISIGTAAFPIDTKDPEALFTLADGRMYQAKAERKAKHVELPPAALQNPFEQDHTVTDVFARLVYDVTEILGSGIVASFVYDDTSHRLLPGPGYEQLPSGYRELLSHSQLEDPCCAQAVRDRKVVTVKDMRTAEGWGPFESAGDAAGLRSVWAMPVLFGEHVFGAIAVYHGYPAAPSERDLQIAQLLMTHATTALSEIRLRESEQRYRSFIQNHPDAILAIDHHGVLFDVNPAFVRLIGFGPESLIGTRIEDWLTQVSSADDSATPLNEWQVVDAEHRVHQLISSTSPILVNGSVRGSYMMLKDVTDERQTDELMRKSEKLSAVGEMAAGVAHEIRNPLTALKGFLQLMPSATHDDQLRYREIMNHELGRIERIIDELILLAKPQAVVYTVCDLRDTLNYVLPLLETQALMNGVEITATVCDRPAWVRCQENHVKQVFVNFIRNAIEAMPSGGRVRIDMSLQDTDHQVVVDISDTGVGVPEWAMPKLGEPFFSTKPNGTGLGLLVSHRILKSHRGQFQVQSTVGSGTTVRVSLPTVDVPDGNVDSPVSPENSPKTL